METVYNKTVSISRMNCSSLATLGTDSLELLFYIVLFILQSTQIVFIYAKKAMEM